MAPTPIRLHVVFLLSLAFFALAVSVSEAATLRLAWDASPDRTVLGYVVYVGTAPGRYTEAHDVGRQTSFAHASAVDGRSYYFAVASYAAGLVGPRSEEVSWVAGVPVPDVPVTDWIDDTPGYPDRPDWSDLRLDGRFVPVCSSGASAGCFDAREVAGGLGPITSMAVTADARLLFIEDGRQVRVVAGGALLAAPALSAGESSRLTGLAVDPEFSTSGAVLVGHAARARDDEWELTIVRYRELRHLLGQGAAIISGLPLPPSGESPIVMDAARRVYVALPAFTPPRVDSRAAYSGLVLRLNPDGTIPPDGRAGSPVLAYGYPSPNRVTWSAANGGELWLSGTDGQSRHSLARVPASVPTGLEWPAVPRVFPLDTAPWPSVNLASFGEVVALAEGVDGDFYVAMRSTVSGASTASFTILHLQPR